MAGKLYSGEAFPDLSLATSDGRTLRVPGGIEGDWRIVLFYRGHW
jgi:hypothetical protein